MVVAPTGGVAVPPLVAPVLGVVVAGVLVAGVVVAGVVVAAVVVVAGVVTVVALQAPVGGREPALLPVVQPARPARSQ